MDGTLMIPGAVALRRGYQDLTLPVVVIAGAGDKVVFKRQSERLRDCLAGSVLQIVHGAGHMVHHLATRQVAEAIARVIEVSAGRACDGQAGAGGQASAPLPCEAGQKRPASVRARCSVGGHR